MNSSFTLSLIEKQLKMNAKHIFEKLQFASFHVMRPDAIHATRCDRVVNKINKKSRIRFNTVSKYDNMAKTNRFFIINLVFILTYLNKKLIHCVVKSKFNIFFNFTSIFTNILLNSIWPKSKHTRAWKKSISWN